MSNQDQWLQKQRVSNMVEFKAPVLKTKCNGHESAVNNGIQFTQTPKANKDNVDKTKLVK